MGPVGQIVKILFYIFLITELVFSVVIYGMATILLCSRTYMPEPVLIHGTIALFLSIVTLSVIHRGFHAVGHDCPFHLYWFAVIFIVILLVQFLFEMFGIRATSRQIWYQQQSLPIQELPGEKFELEISVENSSIQDPDKMAYRVPTNDELEARKRQLYGQKNDAHEFERRHKTRWNPVHPNVEDDKEIQLPLYPVRKSPPYRRRIGGRHNFDAKEHRFGHDDVPQKDKGIHLNEPRLMPINETEDKLKNSPLVLVFHGYSFILKMVCVALAILTGFMYQLEYV
ncbi:uncharacterized protein LOC123681359 [Harmonia axyridis]|uniref:uncharacterized protein LOC123681359 n=1 Tax=Harmonia axyridis TaxID=115357 RepID=UPI001E279749|nr:uncharacterized protein LOC123681359 [Harmonia axyridis]